MGGNFRIRVVENIGEYSVEAFGPAGMTWTVHKGGFHDLEGFKWGNDTKGFSGIDEVNQYFNYEDEYRTIFELVEEE